MEFVNYRVYENGEKRKLGFEGFKAENCGTDYIDEKFNMSHRMQLTLGEIR